MIGQFWIEEKKQNNLFTDFNNCDIKTTYGSRQKKFVKKK